MSGGSGRGLVATGPSGVTGSGAADRRGPLRVRPGDAELEPAGAVTSRAVGGDDGIALAEAEHVDEVMGVVGRELGRRQVGDEHDRACPPDRVEVEVRDGGGVRVLGPVSRSSTGCGR